jgi:signal peptidase I
MLTSEKPLCFFVQLGGYQTQDDGQVTVNGTPESNEIYQTKAEKAVKFPYLVPKGKIFVLGDFRTQATDSRKLGAIPTSDVEGVTIGLLRRRKF